MSFIMRKIVPKTKRIACFKKVFLQKKLVNPITIIVRDFFLQFQPDFLVLFSFRGSLNCLHFVLEVMFKEDCAVTVFLIKIP